MNEKYENFEIIISRAVRSASSATTPANAKSSPSSLGTPSPSIASSSSGASGTSSSERIKATMGYGSAYWNLTFTNSYETYIQA